MANLNVDANEVLAEMARRCGALFQENAILSLQVKQLAQQVDDLLESAEEAGQEAQTAGQ